MNELMIIMIGMAFSFYSCERQPVSPAFTDDKYERLKEYEKFGPQDTPDVGEGVDYDHYDPNLEDYNTEYNPFEQEYNAQDNVQPSSDITDRFEKHYPHAKDVHWRETDAGYEADFEIEGKKHYAQYNAGGDWVMTRREVDWNDAPVSIRKMHESEMEGENDWTAYKIYEIEKPDQEEKTYMVNLGKEVFFDKEGKMIDKKDISGKKD